MIEMKLSTRQKPHLLLLRRMVASGACQNLMTRIIRNHHCEPQWNIST